MLLHEGGFQTRAALTDNPTSYTLRGFTGPIVDIVNNTTDDVDLFITGHTHQAYNCVIDGRPVTSSSSAGRLLTDIDLTLGRNGDVKSVQANNIPMYTGGPHAGTGSRSWSSATTSCRRPLRRDAWSAGSRGDITRTTDAGPLARERARQPDRRRPARRHRRAPTAATPSARS